MVHKHVKHLALFPIHLISVIISLLIGSFLASLVFSNAIILGIVAIGIAILLHLIILNQIMNWFKIGEPHHIWHRKKKKKR